MVAPCILLDDIVDTAGSLCGAAKAIKELGGAKEIYACVTHGVLSGPSISRIKDSSIEHLLLLDTIPYPREPFLQIIFRQTGSQSPLQSLQHR